MFEKEFKILYGDEKKNRFNFSWEEKLEILSLISRYEIEMIHPGFWKLKLFLIKMKVLHPEFFTKEEFMKEACEVVVFGDSIEDCVSKCFNELSEENTFVMHIHGANSVWKFTGLVWRRHLLGGKSSDKNSC